MSWSCKLVSVTKRQGVATFDVEFIESVTGEVVRRPFNASGTGLTDWLKIQCAQTIQQLTETYAYADAQKSQEGKTIDLTGITWPPAQSSDDAARDSWLNRAARLERALKYVDMGLIAANNTQLGNLRAGLITDIKPEYV